MQILKVVLGSTAFFLCLWLTAGVLGDSLLGAGTQECARAAEARRGGSPLGTDDVLEAVCLMNGEHGFSTELPDFVGFRRPAGGPAPRLRTAAAVTG
ncbi:hypothetical protein E0493_05175 [Roseomonas sp. M0104]|uniref:Uncharacterized protein n=1 Tax=Teichococcus coralli TaxID=2545983 RepID=A0A845B9G5_9PROT|nr:hypothetical protein [Pseudoroseomonas coralli]MXP62744.1 hypothetical protein [Pseudoroseomonas coralli]